MLYIITYDINTTVKDYSSLYACIKRLGYSYQHPLESVWFLFSRYDATYICNELKQEMTDRDRVFVGELTEYSDIQGWLPKTFWNWLKNEKR